MGIQMLSTLITKTHQKVSKFTFSRLVYKTFPKGGPLSGPPAAWCYFPDQQTPF